MEYKLWWNFDSVDSAQRAKQNLNGADIYSGCCTLKIEFAKPTRLNVVRNNEDSWDYTNPSLGGGNHSLNIQQEIIFFIFVCYSLLCF